MPHLSLSTALSDLDGHLGSFYEIVKGGWDDYGSRIAKDCQLIFDSRVRANVVHGFMLERAAKCAARSAGRVRLVERQQMQVLVIEQRYALRLKKLDHDSQSRNQPSQQVDDFRSQRSFDEFPEAHHLDLGYVLNDKDETFIEVRLVSPAGNGIAWSCAVEETGVVARETNLFEVAPVVVADDEGSDIVPRETVIPFRRRNANQR